MTAPLFLVDSSSLAGERVVVDGPEGHHAADVRRVTAGEVVDLTDGAGLLLHGVVVEVSRGRVVVDVRQREQIPAPRQRFVVVQALAKGGRDTDAVEAMTEVGVDEILAWTAPRAVAKWSDRVGERWAAAARSAAKQAHRAWVPQVRGPVTTADVCARVAEAAAAIVMHEQGTLPLTSVPLPDTGDVVVIIGPEGGIGDDELAALAEAGAAVCRLGDTVLRTSTAGVAALSVLSAATRWR